jgi:hypothetical protein
VECVLLSLSVEILAGLDGARLIFISRLKVVDLVEASQRLIAGSVLCAPETRIRTTRLECGVLKLCHKEFGVSLD